MGNIITIPSLYPVTCHTDHVGDGSTFVAIKGMHDNGVRYIGKALERGASNIVVQNEIELDAHVLKLIADKRANISYVSNTRQALAEQSAKALMYPARSLRIIGVTGTKGKSTTVFILEHILKIAGFKTAILSSIKNRILDQEIPGPLKGLESQFTTPQPDYLHIFLETCRQQAVDYVIMEVAAQGVSLHRVWGIYFDALIFTNFGLEHSEFYANINDYFNAKSALFKQLKSGAIALLNADDNRIWSLSAQLSRVLTYGLTQWADIKAKIDQGDLSGISMHVSAGADHFRVHAPYLVGRFNVYNILAALSCAHIIGVSFATILQALISFCAVPGRLEKFILRNGAAAFIDYAHTPSSFEAVLSALRPLSSHLIVVFGAGGDRDVLKRPLMGTIAAQFADIIMLTTDNPRSEDPTDIIKHIKAGIISEYMHKVYTELDREVAIKKAYGLSHADSLLVLLGKGPDEYQLIKGIKTTFSESAILRSLQKEVLSSYQSNI